jgi:hypothetical protein
MPYLHYGSHIYACTVQTNDILKYTKCLSLKSTLYLGNTPFAILFLLYGGNEVKRWTFGVNIITATGKKYFG